MTEYVRNKNTNWTVPKVGASTEQALLCVLQDIRDEMQSINSKLNCYRIPKALDAVVRIDKRISKKIGLNKRKSSK